MLLYDRTLGSFSYLKILNIYTLVVVFLLFLRESINSSATTEGLTGAASISPVFNYG